MNDVALQGEVAPQAALPPPKVRMDRSRAYATVHGERGPADRYAAVQFIQDGLPFDAQGFCIIDHPDIQKPGPEGDKLRATLERKLKKAAALKAKERPRPTAPAEGDDDDEATASADEDEGDDDELEPINLEAWLRGEQDVEWQEVTQEVARRYKKRIAKIEDAVDFLVSEGVVPKAQLRAKFKKMVT